MRGLQYRPRADAAQTGDLDSQQQRRFNSGASASSSTANFWDVAGLNVDSALGSPSSAPTSLSFESFGQSAPTTTTTKARQTSRVILPPRPPKSKTGHERKRTKLSTESTPFDNVDYWIQFDNDEGAAAAAGEATSPELSHQKAKDAQQQPPSQTQQPQQQHQQQQHQR